MSPEHPSSKSTDDAGADPVAIPAGRRVPSTELLGARGELIITHAGREYRLRLTQSGKLILTA